ncbi:MAG: HAD-IA family hydrolase [Elusimicrobia bacterium]|nr:HAD-IA family hydrolase [Elusimicrobiota bacterium]
MFDIRLIIFDLDGTLVDTKKDIAIAINHTLEACGMKKRPLEDISECIGGGFVQTLECAFGKEYYRSEALEILREYYRANSVVHSKPYPGVREVLEHFSGKKLAVLTNKEEGISVDILKKLGLYDYFDIVVGGTEGRKKPDPYGVYVILGKLEVSSYETLIVGDMDIDVLTGKYSGIKTCGVTYGIGNRDRVEASRPDILIGDISQLREFVR